MLLFTIKPSIWANFWAFLIISTFTPKSLNMLINPVKLEQSVSSIFYQYFDHINCIIIVNLCVNASTCYKTDRNHFGALFIQKHSNKIKKKKKKKSPSILSLYSAATSCKKSGKVPCIDFSQNLRSLILGPFLKKIIYINFKLLCHCSFMQKIRKVPYTNF